MTSPNPDRLLTEAELEHMRVLWTLGEGSVRAVLDALPAETPRAYTTVATLLRILEEKGFAGSEKVGRSLLYRPVVSRPAYQARTVKRVLSDVFEGDAGALMRQLVQAEATDDLALAEMRSLLDELED